MLGRVRMYEAGFLIFVLGSLTCALAWNHWLPGIRRKRGEQPHPVHTGSATS